MRVGREVKRQVLASELNRRKAAVPTMSDEERKALYEALLKLPKDKIVPALRSAGLSAEADEVENKFAEEHLLEMRNEQLERINALPVEERLPELIAAGFDEEAKALSEELAAGEQGGVPEDDGDGDKEPEPEPENEGADALVEEGDKEPEPEEEPEPEPEQEQPTDTPEETQEPTDAAADPEKKKVGRPRKNA